MANDICVRLGRRIRVLRTKRGWTQQQLADMAAIGRVHVSELENGSASRMRVIETLAGSFDMTASELLKDI